MQIIYCFIEDYINIEDQGFNFGSPYIFNVEVKPAELIIHHKPNPVYIDGLFQRKSSGRISNITAVVGENGTGKTNVLNFLRNSLSGASQYANGFLILMDEDGELRLINHSRKEIGHYIDFKSKKPLSLNTVYYSPIYDFNEYYLDYEPKNFDVSSNKLMREDFYEDQFLSESVNPIEFHVFKNISRQVKFITGHKYSRKIARNLNLPRLVDVVFITPKLTHSGEGLDNVSYDFRDYYTLGVDLWREEQQRVHELKRAEEEKARRRRSFAVDRAYARNGVLFNLWKFLFFTQEGNNSTLREGVVDFTDEEFAKLRELTFEEYIVSFFSHQNIFDPTPISHFVTLIGTLIKHSKGFNVDDQDFVSFETELGSVSIIIEAYSRIAASLSKKLLHGDKPHGFLQFKWHNLSSGERAFLDLFARLSFAKDRISDYVDDNKNAELPKNIYLFIDEGELGFHLQWQKEYIKTIIDVVPDIFSFGTHEPQIQLVFTTHSPISLSDIPRYNTIYLKRNDNFLLSVVTEGESPKHSFGANIHEIMYDAFYLKDGFIGNFAKEVIDEIFAWGNNDAGKDLSREYVRNVIEVVDDPILRLKLEEIYAEKYQLNLEEQVLSVKIAQMEKRLKQIRDDQNRK